jgi:hypothetical protein
MFHWNSLFRPLNLNNARTHCSICRWKELSHSFAGKSCPVYLLERAVPFTVGKSCSTVYCWKELFRLLLERAVPFIAGKSCPVYRWKELFR